MKDKVLISEVGPRDGLQNCKGVMPTDIKKRWIQGLYDAGIREIEVGSFVPPRLFPQLADTAEIAAFAKTLPGLRVLALVPNLRGAQAAIDIGVTSIGFPLSVSETHSIKTYGKHMTKRLKPSRRLQSSFRVSLLMFDLNLKVR